MNDKITMFKIIIILSIFISFSLFASNKEYRIFFKDKGNKVSLLDSNTVLEIKKNLSENCIYRRKKALGENYIDSLDIPLNKSYIDSILKFKNLKLLTKSTWFNYIVVSCDSLTNLDIQKLSFVLRTEITSQKLIAFSTNQIQEEKKINLYDDFGNLIYETSSYNYGNSYNQNKLIHSIEFHKIGINGDGITIGFLDTGFRWKNHESLWQSNIIKEYDFIYNDTNTANNYLDGVRQDNHGTQTLSTIASFKQDTLIGIAHKAKFSLAKTELIDKENHIEEDYYINAVEWQENNGVDILTSSLGYLKFDTPSTNYSNFDLTGKTTLIAQSLNIATAKGVICTTSAGNSGSDASTILTPADADSVFTIGAVRKDGDTLSRKSSRGPINSQNIKPNFVAQGEEVVTVNPNIWNNYTTADGTSFSTPLFAGGIALLLSVHPELRPWEVRNILQEASEQRDHPDFQKGYGKVDFYKAAKLAGSFASQLNCYPIQKFQRFMTFVEANENVSLELYAKIKPLDNFEKFDFLLTNKQNQYVVDIPFKEIQVDSIECFFTMSCFNKVCRYPHKENEYYKFPINVSTISKGISQDLLQKLIAENEIGFIKNQNTEYNPKEISIVIDNQEEVNVEFYDMSGKVVYSLDIPKRIAGVETINLDPTIFIYGVYIAKITKGSNVNLIKFIKSEL